MHVSSSVSVIRSYDIPLTLYRMYQCIMMVDIFQFSNVVCSLDHLCDFAHVTL